MLEQYKELLRKFHDTISQFGWTNRIPELIKEMDDLWYRMSKKDKQASLEYAVKLYQDRIK